MKGLIIAKAGGEAQWKSDIVRSFRSVREYDKTLSRVESCVQIV